MQSYFFYTIVNTISSYWGIPLTKIKIFADSVSDVPASWIKKYEIEIVPLYVIFGDTSYKDSIDITTTDLYRKVEETGIMPRTAAPSPADFIAAFTPWVEKGVEIVFISMSSKHSSTYQNALIAANEFPEGSVHVVDSQNLTGGGALLVLKAAQAAQAGASASEIVGIIEDTRDRVEIEVLISQLDYLHKGGRLSNTQHMIGSLLKIRPVIKIKEGVIYSADRYRGKMEKAIERMVQSFIDNFNKVDPDLVIIAQSLAEKAAEHVKKALLEKTPVKKVTIIEGGCVISSHCGPHSIGIMYMRKNQLVY